ncbi:MAG: outer membrane protein assembly factor BamE [Rhodobacteraceae bacterium]|nr:outer membrane protein assembly factor BamE [Paracoccaceae bacterium]
MTIRQDSAAGRWIRALAAAIVLSVMSACSATFDNHGYIPPEEDLAAILPGLDTRDSVEALVGPPSALGMTRDDAWFYADYRIRNFAWRAPEITERHVVAISFDRDGVVRNIERFGLADGQVVHLSRRVTGSGVPEITLLNQILRNFGRIDVAEALGGDN